MNLGKLRNLIPLRILSVGLLSLLILIPLSSAAGVQYANLTLVGNVLSDKLTDQSQGFLFADDYVLWREGGETLNLYSLKDNSTRTLVTKPASGGWINGYAVSDGTLVWSDNPGPYDILHHYTLASSKSQNIPDTNTTGSQKIYSWNGIKGIQRWDPSIYGDRVVWFQGFPEGTYRSADIAFLNTTTNVMTLINESPTGKDGLEINGDNVIWCAYDENVTDAGTHNSLFLHNLVTGKDTAVSSDPGLKRQDILSGDYVGWTVFGGPLTRVYIYTISSGTTQTVPATSLDQELNVITGDYAVYSECTSYNKKTGERSCDSKIFNIKTGNTWQLPTSLADRQIIGYSDGLFLVEDTRGNIPALSLFRAENLPAIETVTATPALATPGVPEKNGISPTGTTLSETPTLKSPGFASPVMVVALVILCGIAGSASRSPRRKS
jgi:hypothetical protein